MTSPTEPAAPDSVERLTARDEHRYHSYTGNRIPWYVRVFWIGFWVFAIYYVISYLLPALQTEIIIAP